MDVTSEFDDLRLPIMNKISDIAIIIINLTESESNWNGTELSNSSVIEDRSNRWAELVVKGTVLTIIIFLTIFGNLLVLLAVCLTSQLRSTTNCFIVNLALADLLLGISVLPFSATLELNEKQWIFGPVFCNIWAAVDVLCCTASILSLCVISVDRYIGVTRPLAYSNIVTHSRAVVACIFVWVLSIAISVGPLLGWREPPPKNPYICEVTKQTGYVLFSVTFSFYLPSIIIFIVYFRIYKAAVKQTKFLETGVKVIKTTGHEVTKELTLRVHAGAQHVLTAHTDRNYNCAGDKNSIKLTVANLQGRLAKFKRQKKAAKTLGIVVGVFILCWFPFFFILPLGTLCKTCYVPDLLFDIFFWTGYFNSCLNPIIYACSSRDFKRAFRQVLHCAGFGSNRSIQSFRARTINFTLRSTRRSSQGRERNSAPAYTNNNNYGRNIDNNSFGRDMVANNIAATNISANAIAATNNKRFHDNAMTPLCNQACAVDSNQSVGNLNDYSISDGATYTYCHSISAPVIAAALMKVNSVMRASSGTDTDCAVIATSE